MQTPFTTGNERHGNHERAERLGTGVVATNSIDQDANRQNQQQAPRQVRGPTLPFVRTRQREKADGVDEAVGGVVQTVGDQRTGVAQCAGREEAERNGNIQQQNRPERTALTFIRIL